MIVPLQHMQTLIFLIGMPGAGKTYTGRQLANLLSIPFIDTDAEVEKRIGQTISTLWDAEGEAAFRFVEAEVLADTLLEGPAVVATGGGLPIAPGAMDLLLEAGLVIWLQTESALALKRSMSVGGRPLLAAQDPALAFDALQKARLPIYSRAQIVIKKSEDLLQFAQAILLATAYNGSATDV